MRVSIRYVVRLIVTQVSQEYPKVTDTVNTIWITHFNYMYIFKLQDTAKSIKYKKRNFLVTMFISFIVCFLIIGFIDKFLLAKAESGQGYDGEGVVADFPNGPRMGDGIDATTSNSGHFVPNGDGSETSSSTVTEAVVTAYSGVESCSQAPKCVMASGKPAYEGAVACPRYIALGTLVSIQGKTYTCEDRTAKRYDGRFDIFVGRDMNAYNQAIDFGIKKLQVTIHD